MAGANRDQQTWNAFTALSPFARAGSNFLDTLGLAANAGTFGLGGGIVDALQGNEWGTTAHDARLRLNGSTNFGAGTAAEVIGGLGGTKLAFQGVRALPGLVAPLLTAAPAVGTRAAALGATSPSYISTAAKVLAPAAAALGIAGYANSAPGAQPAAAAAAEPADPNVPTSGPNAGRKGGVRIGPDASGPVATVLSPARPRDPQSVLGDALTKVLGNNPTISDIAALGGLVPAAVKPTGTMRDMVFGQAYAQSKAIADSQIASLAEQVQAGTITQAQAQAEAAKVLKNHFDQTAGLVGYDPSKVALPMPGEGDGS